MNLPLVETAPTVPLSHLDELWFQVAGTRCNLACHHCFISCSPTNHEFGFLSAETIERALADSVAIGVKEYYFTGGEPFLHPDMITILERTLRLGPATVLTNGTLFTDHGLARLRQAEETSRYSLEFRVSLDGFTPETNDPVRGHGTFERILRGVGQLLAYDFLPVLTVAQTSDDAGGLFEGFVSLLTSIGYSRPRVKILPTLRLGAEVDRQRGYHPDERVTPEMLDGYDVGQLLCEHARIVTDRGIVVCPILIEALDMLLGPALADAHRPAVLRHAACFTCYQHGALCANASGVRRNA